MKNNGHYFFYSATTILIGVLCAMGIVAGLEWSSNHISREVTVYPSRAIAEDASGTKEAVGVTANGAGNIDTNSQAVAEENSSPTANILPLISSLQAKGTPTAKLPPITATEYLVETLGSADSPSLADGSTVGNGAVVLSEKDDERSLPIASLTKLVTAVVSENLLNSQTEINIGPKVLSTYYGNTANLTNGEELSAGELLYPLLMSSSNDAAEALALAYGQKQFVKAMNDWVYSIGAYHTYFAEPTGLSPENISSAGDLFIILNWIYKNRPDLISIMHTKVKTVGLHTWVNPTHFLNLSAYVGGKDGYIPEAGLTAGSLFDITIDGKDSMVAVIVLGSKNRDLDVLGLLDRVASSTDLAAK